MKRMLNLFLALVITGALGGKTFGAQPGQELPPSVEIVRDVEFGKGGERQLKMHLLRPRIAPDSPMPVIVYIYGGAWRTGNLDQGIRPLTRFAERGYFCVSIEYRFSQEAIFPAQIEDCKCAIRFLRAKAKEFNINPDRIGVWGASAGGHLAALLGTSGDVSELEGAGGWAEFSSRVNAVVDWFGPTDFLKMDAAGSRISHNAPESPESRLIGGPIQENRDKAAKANPIAYVSKDDPPFLIMHGDRDPLVPLNQSELLVAALKKAGVEVKMQVVAGAGHGILGPAWDTMVDEFFDKHLKNGASKQSSKSILFFTKSSGFEHSVVKRSGNSLSHAEQVLVELGKANGFEVVCTKDGGVFTTENIAKFDVFCFYTSGILTESGQDKNPPMSAQGKAALLVAIHGGKGFIGIHSANDSFHFQPDSEVERFTAHDDKVDPYIAMLGGEFIRHGPQQTATRRVVDNNFPGLEGLGASFKLLDEWYAFKDFAKDMHVLLAQETQGMEGIDYKRAPYPATWARRHGQGRVFYTSMGHREDVWTNPVFQKILMGGITWAVGNVEADVSPNIDKATPGYREIQPKS